MLGQGKFLPKHALAESADQLAERWLAEWKDGIEQTGIRPGFIKIGVDGGRLTDVNRKLVQAAARAHLRSGLTIACHTGDGVAAMEEMEVLRDEGVDPSAWIWVHAQNERDPALHERAASRGGWVEFDGVGPETIDRHVELVSHMKGRGLLGRVLISHDAGWYAVGEPGGGTFRSYTTMFERFLQRLKRPASPTARFGLSRLRTPLRPSRFACEANEVERRFQNQRHPGAPGWHTAGSGSKTGRQGERGDRESSGTAPSPCPLPKGEGFNAFPNARPRRAVSGRWCCRRRSRGLGASRTIRRVRSWSRRSNRSRRS